MTHENGIIRWRSPMGMMVNRPTWHCDFGVMHVACKSWDEAREMLLAFRRARDEQLAKKYAAYGAGVAGSLKIVTNDINTLFSGGNWGDANPVGEITDPGIAMSFDPTLF